MIDYPLVPESELKKRIEKLAKKLKENNVDACLIAGISNIYYYTGTIQNGVFFANAEGKHAFFVKKSFERAKIESKLENIFPLTSLKNIEGDLKAVFGFLPETVGFEGDVLPFALYQRYSKALSNTKLIDFSLPLRLIRSVKSKWEIENIRQAGKQLSRLFEHMKGFIKEGVSEIEIAAESERFARLSGHQGTIRMRGFNAELFYSVICAGETANLPTNFDGPSGSLGLYPSAIHPAGTKKAEKGKPVLFDFMGAYMGYLCDGTRIYHIGKPLKETEYAHNKCIEIQNFIAENLKPGTLPSEIYLKTVEKAKKENFYENLMGFKSNQVKFFGHGVGLEVDEFPVITEKFNFPLEENMVIAIEPKKYIDKIGGVGVENTFLVTKNGGEKLIDYPDNLIIV
ncbi:peptidase M24 [Thermotomaculum hydrothermale]|uniref:Peptidase M24 n=1 Tax=Thermotomaculum hydrothermale TaxID=981385 RepID=A0A7R6PLY8_9BACT|nr:Xaa-Pro peptidase family protein [Thermotomaculum hydrothermale]BBB32542.1 peptidase M24 [Thermotomaculum hydrothermale]